MPSFLIRLAQEGDNPQLLDLTRACPVQGPISFYQEREPRFFMLNQVQGDSYRIYVVEHQARIIGSVSCAHRWVYLRGKEVPLWYISDLKIAPGMRGKGVLRDFITQASGLFWEGDRHSHLAFSLIVKTNPAVKLLTAPRPYMPRFVPLGTIRNHAIHLMFRKKSRSIYRIDRARGGDAAAVAGFLKAVYAQKEFAPVIHPADFCKKLEQTPGLSLNNFYIARNQDRIVGVVAVWDQQSFRRIKTLSFSPTIRLSRSLYNSFARVLAFPTMPPAGSSLPYFYISHVAIEQDDPEILRALLHRIHNDHLHSHYLFFIVGLPMGSPLQSAVRGFFHHAFDMLAFGLMPRDSEWRHFDFNETPLSIDTATT